MAQRQISRKEYVSLIRVTAQAIAGTKPVSVKTVNVAKKMVDAKLAASKTTVMGSFWSRTKNVAASVAPYTLPLVAPGIATPLILNAVQQSRAKSQAQAKARAAAPGGDVQMLDDNMGFLWPWQKRSDDENEYLATRAMQHVGISTSPGAVISTEQLKQAVRLAKKNIGDLDVAKRYILRAIFHIGMKLENPDAAKIADFVQGEESRALACEGSAESGAIARSTTPYYFPSFATAGSVPPDVYRAAVLRNARRLARGKTPETKHIFMSQRTIDRAMGMRGVKLQIPGAAPGRVTR